MAPSKPRDTLVPDLDDQIDQAWTPDIEALIERFGADAQAVVSDAAGRGKKSTWSAHARLHHTILTNTLAATGTAVTAALRALIPDHWPQKSWNLRLPQSARDATFAPPGRGTSGLNIRMTGPHLAWLFGLLAGLSWAHEQRAQHSAHRDWQPLTPNATASHTFLIWTRETHALVPADGWCPLDAMLRRYAEGLTPLRAPHMSTPYAMFHEAYTQAASLLDAPLLWFAGFAFWDAIFESEAARKLMKSRPAKPIPQSAGHAFFDIQDMERQASSHASAILKEQDDWHKRLLRANQGFAQMADLARSASPPPRTLGDWFVENPRHRTIVRTTGWDAPSALLGAALDAFKQKRSSIGNLHIWRAYPIPDSPMGDVSERLALRAPMAS